MEDMEVVAIVKVKKRLAVDVPLRFNLSRSVRWKLGPLEAQSTARLTQRHFHLAQQAQSHRPNRRPGQRWSVRHRRRLQQEWWAYPRPPASPVQTTGQTVVGWSCQSESAAPTSQRWQLESRCTGW